MRLDTGEGKKARRPQSLLRRKGGRSAVREQRRSLRRDVREVCVAQSDGATLGLAGRSLPWGECLEEVGSAMSGESKLPKAGAERIGDLPAPEASPRRTPDESTMGLPASGEPLPASSGESALPRLQVGESLAGRF